MAIRRISMPLLHQPARKKKQCGLYLTAPSLLGKHQIEDTIQPLRAPQTNSIVPKATQYESGSKLRFKPVIFSAEGDVGCKHTFFATAVVTGALVAVRKDGAFFEQRGNAIG